MEPVRQMMHVTPVLRRPAAGEHAAPVPHLDGLAQMRRHHPVGPPHIQRLAVGADHDPGDLPITGQHPGLGRGDGRPEVHHPSTGSHRRVLQVGPRDQHPDLRLAGPQRGQLPGRQLVVTQLHQGVGQLLGPGPHIPGDPRGPQHRLQGGLQPFPTDRVQLPVHPQRPVPTLGQRQPPRLGGIRFRPVGVQPGQVVPHGHHDILVRRGGSQLGQRGVGLGQVHPGGLGGGQVLGGGDRRDRQHLVGGHLPGRERRGQRRQLLQRPPHGQQPRPGVPRHPGMPTQPGPHRGQPVDLGQPRHLTGPHRRATAASSWFRRASSTGSRSCSCTPNRSSSSCSASRADKAAAALPKSPGSLIPTLLPAPAR